MHFDQMAVDYARARPPYPDAVFDTLQESGAIGPGVRVLEVGAGAGLATARLIERGSEVVALEPGPHLASLLRDTVPEAEVLPTTLEEARLPEAGFDSVVAATALHWVDLAVGLPKIHATLRPHGLLAVWRTIFGDDTVTTELRGRVDAIVARRGESPAVRTAEQRPTVEDLSMGGWFEPVRSEHWRWSIEMNAEQVGLLFTTFSGWTPAEARAVEDAARDLGGTVTEHYQTVLHLLRRVDRMST